MGFIDMREWMSLLEKAGELRRVTAEVDWDREIGAVARRVLEKKGPALLFENIKGYGSGRCTQVFVSGLGARSRLALALGFQREVANRELVQHVMKKMPLHPHILRHRYAGSRHARDERRHLSWNDRPQGYCAVPPH